MRLNNISIAILSIAMFLFTNTYSQNFKLKYKNSLPYAGIEVGSKGVKMTILEIGKNQQKDGTINLLQDTAVNTDFINFTPATFSATLQVLTALYNKANKEYNIPSARIFTAISSGVKILSEKEHKMDMVTKLADSFKTLINEPSRLVTIIDVVDEARLSHLGIIPESRRYNTFLIDIGSGNTKGGYFPNGNTRDIRLFQLTWGTKSVTNETVKRVAEDKTLSAYNRQLSRVLSGSADEEITYAVNVSGAYKMSDNIAFSGGIAWSVATLLYPELVENSVVPVSYDEIFAFSEKLFKNYSALSDTSIANSITDATIDKSAVKNEVKKVNKVFDQRALMAGTGLLLKIMRQFEGVYEKKQFFLVKNGQVGWISAFVDQSINNLQASKQ